MKKYLFIFLGLLALYFIFFKVRIIPEVKGVVIDSVTKEPVSGILAERYRVWRSKGDLHLGGRADKYSTYTNDKGEFTLYSEIIKGWGIDEDNFYFNRDSGKAEEYSFEKGLPSADRNTKYYQEVVEMKYYSDSGKQDTEASTERSMKSGEINEIKLALVVSTPQQCKGDDFCLSRNATNLAFLTKNENLCQKNKLLDLVYTFEDQEAEKCLIIMKYFKKMANRDMCNKLPESDRSECKNGLDNYKFTQTTASFKHSDSDIRQDCTNMQNNPIWSKVAPYKWGMDTCMDYGRVIAAQEMGYDECMMQYGESNFKTACGQFLGLKTNEVNSDLQKCSAGGLSRDYDHCFREYASKIGSVEECRLTTNEQVRDVCIKWFAAINKSKDACNFTGLYVSKNECLDFVNRFDSKYSEWDAVHNKDATLCEPGNTYCLRDIGFTFDNLFKSREYASYWFNQLKFVIIVGVFFLFLGILVIRLIILKYKNNKNETKI